MTLLSALGFLSAFLVAGFVVLAYRDNTSVNGEQTRRQAIIEVLIGICIGFGLNWSMNWILLPLVGAKFTAGENLSLGLIYTLISVLRGYVIRRWAERHIRAFSARVAKLIGSK